MNSTRVLVHFLKTINSGAVANVILDSNQLYLLDSGISYELTH
jgi:hypothetical protein